MVETQLIEMERITNENYPPFGEIVLLAEKTGEDELTNEISVSLGFLDSINENGFNFIIGNNQNYFSFLSTKQITSFTHFKRLHLKLK